MFNVLFENYGGPNLFIIVCEIVFDPGASFEGGLVGRRPLPRKKKKRKKRKKKEKKEKKEKKNEKKRREL